MRLIRCLTLFAIPFFTPFQSIAATHGISGPVTQHLRGEKPVSENGDPIRNVSSQANLIFEGKVQKVEFGYSNFSPEAGGFPLTYITYEIRDVLFGKYEGRTITLQQIGGLTGSSVMTLNDTFLYQENDRDVVFIRNNGSRFTPVIGRYRVHENNVFDNNGFPYLEGERGDVSLSKERVEIPYFTRRELDTVVIDINVSKDSESETPSTRSQSAKALSLDSLKKKIIQAVSDRPDSPKEEASIDQRNEGLAKVKFEASKAY